MKKTLASLLIGLTYVASSTSVFAEDLMQMYQQALQNDPVVLKAAAQYRAASEDIELARSILLPQLNGFGSYEDGSGENISDGSFAPVGQLIDRDYDTTTYGLRLDMQIYHHDSWLRLDTAKKSAHRSDIALQIARQDLLTRVSQAYFTLLSAKDDLMFAESQRKAFDRQLEQTKQRFSVGLTAITDVYEAQAQFDDSTSQVILAQNNIYSAEEALRVITNVYPRDVSILNTDRFSATNPIPDSANEWQQTAEAKNLDLIAQKITVDIAKENIGIAKSGHYPTLDLTGTYANTDNTIDFDGLPENDLPDLDSHSIGITLTVPIYSGGGISASVRQAQEFYVSASEDLSLTHRDVVRTTRNAYNTVLATIAGIKAFEQSVLSAEKALAATEAGFEVGTRTIVDVLDSTRNLFDARRNLSTTRYSYINFMLELKRSAGTITEQDIIEINKGLMPQS